MERVPAWIVVATGVVLSVKLPKVPMPATAAAAPRTPSEPTTLRAVELLRALLSMSVSPCVRASGPSLTQTTIREQPQDTRPLTARKAQEVGDGPVRPEWAPGGGPRRDDEAAQRRSGRHVA